MAQNEYLVTENRILRNQIQRRIRLIDPERISLASVAKGLGRKGLQEVVGPITYRDPHYWGVRFACRTFGVNTVLPWIEETVSAVKSQAPKLPRPNILIRATLAVIRSPRRVRVLILLGDFRALWENKDTRAAFSKGLP